MVEKDLIIRELGEVDLLLPHQIKLALLANDRIKYFFTLLQEAINHSNHPGLTPRSLVSEREFAGVTDPLFDEIIQESSSPEPGTYLIPHMPEIIRELSDALRTMAAPFHAGSPNYNQEYLQRVSDLLKWLSEREGPVLLEEIHQITSADRSGSDSIHMLVMDLHKELIRLESEIATVIIDGAHCFLINPEDETYIRAFMMGLNRTSPLKFDHPGLGTTATRNGGFLVIQNDIGLTDAHVLVIKIQDLDATITYTDIHMNRLSFFQSMIKPYPVIWSDTLSKSPRKTLDEDIFHMSSGSYDAQTPEEMEQFLSWLGSRIVFLIDWNKARKSLRNFLLNKDAISVLATAAEMEAGHRGYLKLGGEQLIYEILESGADIPLRFGEPFYQRLGREKSSDFFLFVMETTTKGLLGNQSILLIKDTIRAELLRRFQSTKETMFDICIEHASYLIEVADLLYSQIRLFQGNPAHNNEFSKRAKEWERKADERITIVRNLSRRIHTAQSFISLLNVADDAMDSLEEACFLYSLLQLDEPEPHLFHTICQLLASTLKSCQEYLRAIIMAKRILTLNNPENIQDFLRAADEVIRIEEDCDFIFRKIQTEIFSRRRDSSILLLYTICQNIEASTNTLMKTIFVIRDEFLDTMMR